MEISLKKTISGDNEGTVKPMYVIHQNKLDRFFQKQSKNITAWFLVSLIFQGVFLLPIPVVLSYYFGAPGYLLVITLGLFFANIIAGMASAGVRTIISILAASIVVHALLILIFTV